MTVQSTDRAMSFRAADTQTGHDQILKHVDSGPHFADAREILAVKSRGRGAHADHRAGMPGLAQALRRAHGRVALLLGQGRENLRAGIGQIVG